MSQDVGTAGKIDFEFLIRMLNPALFVVLAGGLLLGFDLVPLIIAGVFGYTIWGVLNIILRRKKRNAILANYKGKNPPTMPFDYGLVASILNPVVLFILCVGVVKGWSLDILILVGVVGYGLWFFINHLDRKAQREFNKKLKRR